MVLRRSMKLKMIVVFIAFISTTVGVVGLFSYQSFRDSVRHETDALNLEIARHNGHWISSIINASLGDVMVMAALDSFVDAVSTWDDAGMERDLKTLSESTGSYYYLEVVDPFFGAPPRYVIRYRLGYPEAAGTSVDLAAFRAVVEDGEPQVFFQQLPTAPVVNLLAPVMRNGSVVAVLNGALTLEFIEEAIRNVRVGDGGYLFLVDHLGQLVAHPDRDSWGNPENVNLLPIVREATGGGEGTLTFNNVLSGQDEMGAWVYLELGWAIIVVVPEDEAMASVEQLQQTLLFILLIFLAGGSVIAYAMVRRVTVPLSNLTRSTERIVKDLTRSKGKPLKSYKHYRIPVKSRDEVGELARSLNHLTQELVRSHTELESLVVERTSKLQQMNLELTEANRRLTKADKLKSEFLANMSHELRTPLNSIIGFSEVLMSQSFGELTPQQEEFLNDIHNAGRHLLELINEILDLAKIEAGRMDLHLQEIAVIDTVHEVQEIVRPLYTRKGLSFSVELPEDLPRVRADALRLKQILYNLISNAIKFTPSYGLVRVTARPVRDMVRVDIIDTGIGIKKKNYEAIFREFTQLDMSVSREHEGTGLGLPLAKKLVEMHGGRIWFKSVVGAGSTFSFTVPMASSPAPAAMVAFAPRVEGSTRPRPAGFAPGAPPAVPPLPAVEPPAVEASTIVKERLAAPAPAAEENEVKKAPAPRTYVARPTVSASGEKPTRSPIAEILAMSASPPPAAPSVRAARRGPAPSAKRAASAGQARHTRTAPAAETTHAARSGTAKERPAPAAATPPSATSTSRPSAHSSKVLVIDDSEETRNALKGILEAEGYDVIFATDGEAGIRKARQLNPSAILLDILLPDINGWDVLKKLKEAEETSEIPVIVVSILDNASKGVSMGAVDFFVKPVDRDQLLDRLRRAVVGRGAREGGPMRVLVIDDQPQAVKLVSTVLESNGYEVIKAYGGVQGLDLARSERPSMIILDLIMPDMSGMEVLTELKKDPGTREIPVMVLTAKHLSKKEMDEMKDDVLSITRKEDFSRERLLKELDIYARSAGGKEVA